MEKKLKKSLILVAGGKGKRMETKLPKQFLPLGGQPLLMHTIRRFHNWDPEIRMVLVLPFDYIETWNRLCSEQRFLIPHQVVQGGEERFYSVRNGLSALDDEGLVAIHDGVRPFVTEQVIARCFQTAAKHGGAIPVISPSESLRKMEGEKSVPVDRSQYYLVQTPQTFRLKLIREAYQKHFEDHFTDDATVFEAAGHQVSMIPGNPENIKITRPVDFKLAAILATEIFSDPR